jgi:hypothetical protein
LFTVNTKRQYIILGATSNTLPVTSGVPQGSILGPLLFVLYVNDLPDAVTSSQVAMFADDTKLFTTVKREDDCKRLQSDLDNVQTWSLASGLPFNEKKCKSQRITRKIMPITKNYKLNTLNIQQTDSERDLGVWVENRLTWNKQVNEQSTKANKLLGYIRRSSLYIHNTAVRHTLYLALVRPHLGYATQTWAPQSVELLKQVERTQRRADLQPVLPPNMSFQNARHPPIKDPSLSESTRIWNLLTDQLTLDTCGLSTFKTVIFNYYSMSLRTCYNVNDPRSYKTICPQCNSVRSLSIPISCCM